MLYRMSSVVHPVIRVSAGFRPFLDDRENVLYLQHDDDEKKIVVVCYGVQTLDIAYTLAKLFLVSKKPIEIQIKMLPLSYTLESYK